MAGDRRDEEERGRRRFPPRQFGICNERIHTLLDAHGRPAIRERSITEISSASFDSSRMGVGSSPFVGDMASSRLMVPQRPTVSQTTRYAMRLAAYRIPQYGVCRIVGLRQSVGIGQVYDIHNGDSTYQYPQYMEQLSPHWSFRDGNISWHLRVYKGEPQPFADGINDPAQLIGTSPRAYDTDTAVLYNPPFIAVYTPPFGALPPGSGIGDLSTFYDLRFGWRQQNALTLDYEVIGPALIMFYATVRQTDPDTRPPFIPPLNYNTSVLSPEEQFILANPRATYQWVAGSMMLEIGAHDNRPGHDIREAETPLQGPEKEHDHVER